MGGTPRRTGGRYSAGATAPRTIDPPVLLVAGTRPSGGVVVVHHFLNPVATRYVSKDSERQASGLKALACAKLPRSFFKRAASAPPWNIFATRPPPGARQARPYSMTASTMASDWPWSTMRLPVVAGAASERTRP